MVNAVLDQIARKLRGGRVRAGRVARWPGEPKSAEDRLIATYFRPLATHPGALKLTDDAALLAPPAGHDLVLTADAIIGGVHFFPEDAADMVAKKALRVNLSDLAAKGAKPVGFLLTLALPKSVPESLGRAVRARARHRCRTAMAVRCSAAIPCAPPGRSRSRSRRSASVPTNTMVRRSGARAGDAVMVTGTIGDAALGLELRDAVTAAKRWKLDNKHQLSTDAPLSAAAAAQRAGRGDPAQRQRGDGRLRRARGRSRQAVRRVRRFRRDRGGAACRCRRRRASVVASEPAAIEKVLTGGDDYEIVCTVPPERLDAISAPPRKPRACRSPRSAAIIAEQGAAAVPRPRRQADAIQADVLQSFLKGRTEEFRWTTGQRQRRRRSRPRSRRPIAAATSCARASRPSPICAIAPATTFRTSPSNTRDGGAGTDAGIRAQLGGARRGRAGSALRRDAVAAAGRRRAVRPQICGAARHSADGRAGDRLAGRRRLHGAGGAARARALYARHRRRHHHRAGGRARARRPVVPALPHGAQRPLARLRADAPLRGGRRACRS